MKRIIVTAAGRKEYLSILLKYIKYAKQLGEFDGWHLWHNTEKEEDISYIYDLEKQYDFIKVIPFPDSETLEKTCFISSPIYNAGKMVYACTIKYFYTVDSTDENAVYLKLDDDIVFIEKHSIGKLFEYRLENKTNFLVYGNTINNTAMANIHQKIGVLSKDFGQVSFNPTDNLGLYSGKFVEFTHNNFFEKYKLNLLKQYNFEPLEIENYTPVAIQVISWWGKDYKKFGGIIPQNEHDEIFQASIRPKIEHRKNIILGTGLFSHYSAEVTRDYMRTTDILSKYEKLADEYLK